MLWIEYNSSAITKEVVHKVVTQIGELTSSVPVAAKDWKPGGFGIIVTDGNGLGGLGDYDYWSAASEPVRAPDLTTATSSLHSTNNPDSSENHIAANVKSASGDG